MCVYGLEYRGYIRVVGIDGGRRDGVLGVFFVGRLYSIRLVLR